MFLPLQSVSGSFSLLYQIGNKCANNQTYFTVFRLQNVQLKPRALKKCAHAVSKATESILTFTTIIGKEETKTKGKVFQ